ncbi:uncharacterized protein LOC124443380 isoform X3 [Xenia sp. Carnegie-2017]|uniref:uncharacterized protein LOC124443380 isoform X3 n=1 Tax=Xenia sp. Carnegie-2017 TaxID=2897299 RepID=UPI001F04FD44|nr:uncharacterized protein LOC124443380 isoform X3 [Xenia sp. Carnegie-2017]
MTHVLKKSNRYCFAVLMLCVTGYDLTFAHRFTNDAQGHVSKIDRKYLTKGDFYRGSSHYWPLDVDTQLRDVRFSREGRFKGSRGYIKNLARGYLSLSGHSWVRLGKFAKDCICQPRLCRSKGISVGFWLKLPRFDTESKVIFGNEKQSLINNTGFLIYQTSSRINNRLQRLVIAQVYISSHLWKRSFPVQPGTWFYLTVTWSVESGLRMYKDSILVNNQRQPKNEHWESTKIKKCVLALSPPILNGTTLNADYDDVVIWEYLLNHSLMNRVYQSTIDPPKIVDCKNNWSSLIVTVDDRHQIYDIVHDFEMTWWKSGSDRKSRMISNSSIFMISQLVPDIEYFVKVRRRMFVSAPSKQRLDEVPLRSYTTTCSTKVKVPSEPKNFKVREKADTYFLLQWDAPKSTYGPVVGYTISYRVDDFENPPKWTTSYRADVIKQRSLHLRNLLPFTDYIIQLSCHNEHGRGKSVSIKATTDQGVPSPPRFLKAKVKDDTIMLKWREPRYLNGLVKFMLFTILNGTGNQMICQSCIESHKVEHAQQLTNYTFFVVAQNVNNDARYRSLPSNYVTVITPSYTPSPPQNVSMNFTIAGLLVNWKRPSKTRGSIEYKLLISKNGSSAIVMCDECGLNHLIKNLLPHMEYTLWVIAYNVFNAYESEPSEKIIINTAKYVPTTPTNIKIHEYFSGVEISWSSSSVADGKVHYNLLGLLNGVRKIFCTKCGLRYMLNETRPRMSYSFWVIAYNIKGGFESLQSSVFYFETPHKIPSRVDNIMLSHINDSNAIVTWSFPKGLKSSERIIGCKVILYDFRGEVDVKQTIYSHVEFNNLAQFSKYYVTVQAVSRAGYGPTSPPLTIQTKDKDECAGVNDDVCNKHAHCTNSAGSFFCSCNTGYIGDGLVCKVLPSDAKDEDFCTEERLRNITWKKTYYDHEDKNVCPRGTTGIATRKCLKGNFSKSLWANPDLSNCVSNWMLQIDDQLADRRLNTKYVSLYFLDLLNKNDVKGLYGGDVIKSVHVLNMLINRSINNELNENKSNRQTVETLLKIFVNISGKIISSKHSNVWNDLPKEKQTEESLKIIENLDRVILTAAKTVNYSSIADENIFVIYGRKSSFLQLQSDFDMKIDMMNVTLPVETSKINTEDESVAIVKYMTLSDILSPNKQRFRDLGFINSPILSISMYPPLSTPFKNPLEFVLNNKKTGHFDGRKCVFIDNSRHAGLWSNNGCKVFNYTDKFTVCHCYHMTSFSVLMQVTPVSLSHSDELVLSWITIVGLSISLVALGLAFLTFMLLPRPCGHKNNSRCFMRCDKGYRPNYLKKVRTSIHSNLILSLAVGEVVFLWGIERRQDKTTCFIVAVALHYLFLVAFHWMAAEGVVLYLYLIKVFQRKSANKDKRMFILICWGIPAVIVCFSLVAGHRYYLHETCCWLSLSHGMIWAFVGPTLAIILVNTFFLCCTFYVMEKRKNWAKVDKSIIDRIRYWTKGAAIVMCLLGVTWVFGVFYIDSNSVALAYLFTICNVFQGLFIFIFHCLLDEKIRAQYYRVFCAVTDIESGSHSNSGGNKPFLLWSFFPLKLHENTKSESFPTDADNVLKQRVSSSHSLSTNNDRQLLEVKEEAELARPRGMSSIYHDSDENMDNIPDNITTVKHGSKSNSERQIYEEDTSVVDGYLLSTLLQENSEEFVEVPRAICENCVYEDKDLDEQLEKIEKTKSLQEIEVYTDVSKIDNHETTEDDETRSCKDSEDNEEHLGLLIHDNAKNESNSSFCKPYRSVIPNIVLSDFSKSPSSKSPPYLKEMLAISYEGQKNVSECSETTSL